MAGVEAPAFIEVFMTRRNTKTAQMGGRKVLLFNSDDNNSSPPRQNILYMQYEDTKGRKRIKELAQGKTPNQYRNKHGG